MRRNAGGPGLVQLTWDADPAPHPEPERTLPAAGRPSQLDWRRLRRAERRVLAARVRLLTGRQADAEPGASTHAVASRTIAAKPRNIRSAPGKAGTLQPPSLSALFHVHSV